MSRRSLQMDMFKKGENAYGGELRNTRKGRQGPRTLSTKNTMHLVLRSGLARGPWSFRRHDVCIRNTVQRFSRQYGVRVLSIANAGNHLHLQIQLSTRQTYRAFIKALTGSLALAVTGASFRCSIRERARLLEIPVKEGAIRFWDYRPFTRIVQGYKALLTLKDYLEINRLEGFGYDRDQARFLMAWSKDPPKDPYPSDA